MGVTFDSHLSFNIHIDNICRADTAKIVACAMVSSRLDYCNALLTRTSEFNLDKLQRVQNTIARVLTGLCGREHITLSHEEMHWLPIRARITFKVTTVVCRLCERRQPPCFADLISDYAPIRTLRSSTNTVSAESSFKTDIVRRSFRYVANTTCNNLQADIKTVDSLSLFRKG